MFPRWNSWSYKSYFSCGISTLVSHHTVVFLLLTHCCGGQSHIVGPSKLIVAMVGDDIILPCHLEPAMDVIAKTLEWSRLDLNPRFVHMRRDGVELLINQHRSYIGRTSLSTDKLKHGDISLKLSKVKLSDEGTYRCFIPPQSTSVVELVVGALSSPVIIIAELDKTISRVVLQCESKGWYPEPEVLWLDGEGNLLSAGPTETVRGPDDLYTVSSRVTVEKRHSNSFTCRVQQNHINQTRVTKIHIPVDAFMAQSCSAARIIIVLISSVGIMVFSGVFFVLWKFRKNTVNNKMQANNESEQEAEERQQLTEDSLTFKHLIEEKATLDEKLQKKNEEQEDLSFVITVLMEKYKELESTRDKWKLQLEETEKERSKIQTKLEKLDKKENKKKMDLLLVKQELEGKKSNNQIAYQSIVERLHKMEDITERMTERKVKVESKLKTIKERKQKKLPSDQSEKEEGTNKNTD